MFACHYRVVSGGNGVLLLVLCGISSGVWSELSRVFIELRVSDRDIKTLSKTELGSESSVCWRALRTPFTGSPFCSSSLKRAPRYVSRYRLWTATIAHPKPSNIIISYVSQAEVAAIRLQIIDFCRYWTSTSAYKKARPILCHQCVCMWYSIFRNSVIHRYRGIEIKTPVKSKRVYLLRKDTNVNRKEKTATPIDKTQLSWRHSQASADFLMRPRSRRGRSAANTRKRSEKRAGGPAGCGTRALVARGREQWLLVLCWDGLTFTLFNVMDSSRGGQAGATNVKHWW